METAIGFEGYRCSEPFLQAQNMGWLEVEYPVHGATCGKLWTPLPDVGEDLGERSELLKDIDTWFERKVPRFLA